jgi:hypothetical protein
VRITFGIHTPTSILDMYGHWLNNFSANIKFQVIVGVGVICWTVWLSRNDIVFNQKKYFYSYAGYLQGHILDKNMIDVQKGGWKEYFNNKYNIGAGDYENLLLLRVLSFVSTTLLRDIFGPLCNTLCIQRIL